jgi:hypothetical protein
VQYYNELAPAKARRSDRCAPWLVPSAAAD